MIGVGHATRGLRFVVYVHVRVSALDKIPPGEVNLQAAEREGPVGGRLRREVGTAAEARADADEADAVHGA